MLEDTSAARGDDPAFFRGRRAAAAAPSFASVTASRAGQTRQRPGLGSARWGSLLPPAPAATGTEGAAGPG